MTVTHSSLVMLMMTVFSQGRVVERAASGNNQGRKVEKINICQQENTNIVEKYVIFRHSNKKYNSIEMLLFSFVKR